MPSDIFSGFIPWLIVILPAESLRTISYGIFCANLTYTSQVGAIELIRQTTISAQCTNTSVRPANNKKAARLPFPRLISTSFNNSTTKSQKETIQLSETAGAMMPRTGIEPVIFALRVRRLTTWPTGLGSRPLLASWLKFALYIQRLLAENYHPRELWMGRTAERGDILLREANAWDSSATEVTRSKASSWLCSPE